MSADILALLYEGGIATTAALLLVLLLRKPVRHAFGAGCIPLLWALVPLAQLAVLMPAPARNPAAAWVMTPAMTMAGSASPTGIENPPAWAWEPWVFGLWLGGALVMAAWLMLLQRRFHQRLGTLTPHAPGVFLAAHAGTAPAVLGILRPRIVLPADFQRRYSVEQQTLILAHERSHAGRGDVMAQAIASLMRCLYWFNPLIHLAIHRLRHDQELASDADVARQHPDSRRQYAATLLDAQLAVLGLPAGCLWQSSHPLKERILMLKTPPPSGCRRQAGLALVMAMSLGGSLAAWASQGSQSATAIPATPSTDTTASTMYRVNMEVHLDGDISLPEVITTADQPIFIAMTKTDGPRSYRSEFRLSLDGDTGHITQAQIQLDDQFAGAVDLDALNAGRMVEVPTTEGLPTLSLRVAVAAQGDSMPAPGKTSREPSTSPAVPAWTARKVSFKVQRITLRQALEQLAHQADVSLHGANVLDRLHPDPVLSIAFIDIPMTDLIALVLNETSVSYAFSEEGIHIIP